MSDLLDDVRARWNADDPARLERVMETVGALLAEQLTGTSAAVRDAAATLLENPDVSAWITELAGAADARQALLLEALGQYGEQHGLQIELVELLEHSDGQLRAGILRAVARSRPPALIGEWIKGLSNDDPEARLGAINLLAVARDPIAVRPLASMVVEGRPETVQAAVWAIGEIGIEDPIAESVLVDAIAARFCTAEAVEALGRMGGPAVLPVLLEQARRNDTTAALLAAARLVERHPEHDKIEVHARALEEILRRHKDPAARLLAAVVLVRLGREVDPTDIDAALL